MRTIARILAPLLVLAGLMAGTQGHAQAAVPTCDPGDYYALQVTVADLEHKLYRQAERHADELDAMNDYLLDADARYTFAVNAHAEELAGVFRQLDAAQADAREERDERDDAEAELARAERRIARLVAKVAALKARR